MPHFLKRLELNGFKSFAGKTTLDFPAGITAIVGPNGSGKSNVVDAVRWLLGEREAKNLRGGKVEDLIFAGTPSRARQSQAEAGLFFDNNHNFFPVDFGEVSIVRQVSRDGVSRYFLNKSEVRLKDLVDFFAKARLGTKGMVVVTQGNSDLFIKASPIERREMLEEMLGLREYQIKKSQAENRLRGSRINLDKVQALIEEILPHLRSLRRQTGRWEKRSTLKDDLKNSENIFFGFKWQHLEREITRVKKEIEEHQRESKKLFEEKAAAEANQKHVEAKEPKERTELRAVKEEITKLLEKRSELQKELGRLEVQVEFEQKQPRGPNLSFEKLLGLIKKVKMELEGSLGRGSGYLEITVRELVSEIDTTLSVQEKDKSKISDGLKISFARLSEELKALGQNLGRLIEKEKLLSQSQESFHESFKTAVLSVEVVKEKIENWESRHQKKLFEKERLEFRLDELRHQINQAGRHLTEFSSAHGISIPKELTESELEELERKIFKLRGDLASIGDIDEAVMKEAKETENRYEFLKRELEDITQAKEDLEQLIDELNEKIKVEFNESLVKINKEFNNFFRTMFDGGHAKLKIKGHTSRQKNIKKEELGDEVTKSESLPALDENNVASQEEETGVEVELGLPKKRLTSLDVLSGGERSLVGIAALFALISVSPPPFLVLDEIDAALDERNTRRFAQILKDFSKKTQFVVVTHNRATMEAADILYGVTLNSDGASKIFSLKLEPPN